MPHRYFRHHLPKGRTPHQALSSFAEASGVIVRVDRRPDRTEVIVATEAESYEDFAAKSELGKGEEISESDVAAFRR
jgi:hypothetical protein